MLGPKHQGGPYSATRAFSIVGGELPKRLIESAKNKRAVDLSPTLAANLPLTSPGIGTGQHRQVYLKVDFPLRRVSRPVAPCPSDGLAWRARTWCRRRTRCRRRARQPQYAPEVRGWLAEYEKNYGPRGESSLTTEQVPLAWTCGRLRVIDVRTLVGSTSVERLARVAGNHAGSRASVRESSTANCKAGDVVLFQTGHLDTHLQPQPHDAGRVVRSAAGQERRLARSGTRRDRVPEEEGDSLRGHRRARPGRRRSASAL